MLDYIIEDLELKDTYLIVNDTFYKQFEEWNPGLNLINNGVQNEQERKGALGDLAHTIKTAEINDDVLVLGGDNLYEFNIQNLKKFFLENGNTIAVHDLQDKEKVKNKFGVVELDQENKIVGFEEKPKVPKTSLAATLVYMFKKESLNKLINFISTTSKDNAGHMVDWLSKNDNVYAWKFKEEWIDIGSFKDLERAQGKFL
jgi:glucose-1-phosphate thymidylyltransferase